MVAELGEATHRQALQFVDEAGCLRSRHVAPYIVADAAFRLDEHVMTQRCVGVGCIPV